MKIENEIKLVWDKLSDEESRDMYLNITNLQKLGYGLMITKGERSGLKVTSVNKSIDDVTLIHMFKNRSDVKCVMYLNETQVKNTTIHVQDDIDN